MMKPFDSIVDGMDKVLIIGCPGSGKSTFARKLAPVVDLPLIYLDILHHHPDHSLTPTDQFDRMLQKILVKAKWIIDGNYMRTMALRLRYADTVFYLDYDTDTCLAGILEREGTKRIDMPWEKDETDAEFIEYVQTFHQLQRPKIEALLKTSESSFRLIRFDRREQSEQFLNELKKAKEKGVGSI